MLLVYDKTKMFDVIGCKIKLFSFFRVQLVIVRRKMCEELFPLVDAFPLQVLLFACAL